MDWASAVQLDGAREEERRGDADRIATTIDK
jgi:hypothetical protein